jgi:23S rRNA pseudouridine1911/1915/1917 synthase
MKVQFCVISEKAVRVDMYISALFDDFSRSYVQRLIDDGYVQVNGKVVKKNLKIQNKDELCITLHTQSLDIEAQDIPIDVVYEDKEIIILNKDAGINVHPVPGE